MAVQIAYKKGFRYEDDSVILRISKIDGMYQATVTEKGSLNLIMSKRYNTKRGVSNFTRNYGIEII